MDGGDFERILNRSTSEVTEPGLYPAGTWRVRCTGCAVKEDDEGHAIFNFAFVAVEPHEDVDPAELTKPENFDGNKIWVRRRVESQRDLYDLKNFFKTLGLETEGKTFAELVKEVRGQEADAYINTRTYTNNQGETKVENTLKNFMPAE